MTKGREEKEMNSEVKDGEKEGSREEGYDFKSYRGKEIISSRRMKPKRLKGKGLGLVR